MDGLAVRESEKQAWPVSAQEWLPARGVGLTISVVQVAAGEVAAAARARAAAEAVVGAVKVAAPEDSVAQQRRRNRRRRTTRCRRERRSNERLGEHARWRCRLSTAWTHNCTANI